VASPKRPEDRRVFGARNRNASDGDAAFIGQKAHAALLDGPLEQIQLDGHFHERLSGGGMVCRDPRRHRAARHDLALGQIERQPLGPLPSHGHRLRARVIADAQSDEQLQGPIIPCWHRHIEMGAPSGVGRRAHG
jgi:hypothetical protein